MSIFAMVAAIIASSDTCLRPVVLQYEPLGHSWEAVSSIDAHTAPAGHATGVLLAAGQ